MSQRESSSADQSTAIEHKQQGYATGGRIEPHGMRRVDHYDRAQVLTPNGTLMCQYTPVFEEDA